MKLCSVFIIFAAFVLQLVHGEDIFSELSKNLTGGIKQRILGGYTAGVVAGVNQFPWMAAVGIRKPSGQMLCGGSLIHQNWVITAAHCVINATEIYVRLGSNKWASGGQLIPGRSAWIHPSFNPTNYNNNIGIIYLNSSAIITKNVTIIKLLPKSSCCDATLYKDYFSGWGYNSTTSPGATDNLKFYNATEISNSECITRLVNTIPSLGLPTVGSWIVSSVQCTFNPASQGAVWIGDDGGPLVRPAASATGTNYLVGVLSKSDYLPANATSAPPAVFTRVCHYIDLLQAFTGLVF